MENKTEMPKEIANRITNKTRNENIDREWLFTPRSYNGMDSIAKEKKSHVVNLPHDYMIESDVQPDAPAGPAMGYFTAGVANYTKNIEIPQVWENDIISLKFDGVMMNATVEVNGCKVALQHYGYAPFCVNITPYIYWGENNRITITTNPSMQPNSRWYSGAGIFRSVELIHTPLVCIANNGIYGYTKRIDYDCEGKAATAYLQTEVQIENHSNHNQIAMVEVFLTKEGSDEIIISRKQKIQINPNSEETAIIPLTMDSPDLWNIDTPNLYELHGRVIHLGSFGAHFTEASENTIDETSTLFGIRTITADSKNGLCINNTTVKLKGGCLHHDNGLLGAVSLYDSEARRIKKLKEIGFNAIRTAHNPPSSAFLEACDRLGMFVFNEAFDVWGMMKQPGDYSMFFDTDWEKDLTAFVKRDRCHPSVIIWSTGNEILEHGGLYNGYTLATRIANLVHALDSSRPVSNGICSFWTGLDDKLSAKQSESYGKIMGESAKLHQNCSFDAVESGWEDMSEPFVNGLDIVGYNYLEDKYQKDHELYPERVMLGSENFPKEIGRRWPIIEKTPYLIGDFTWTAWDYIGEAGIGKAIHVDPTDPILKKGPIELMSHTSEFPYRTANDADVDINGTILAQGFYRSIVWGSAATYLFSYNPATYDKVEMTSLWGFTAAKRKWSWDNAEGKNIKLLVFSRAEEIELFKNGVSLGKKKQGESLATDNLPFSFIFHTTYEPGELVAVSYTNGREISRDTLKTPGAPYAVHINSEENILLADGHSALYVPVEIVDKEGCPVFVDELLLTASVEGPGILAGFGSANPITAENYTSCEAKTYEGKALAIIRSDYKKGTITLTITAEGMTPQKIQISVC